MDEAMVVLVVSLLVALLVRLYWRLLVNLLVVTGMWLIFTAIFFAAIGIEQLSDAI